MTSIEPGRSFDRYVVDGVLGEGGMATVYRVRHKTLGSPHALKILKIDGQGLLERLVQEGRAQATLRHPNIVAVTDVVEVEGRPGLVMEYVEGPTLETWLAVHQPTLEQAEGLFLGILAGVARAHRSGLVHRDLKPGNVLLQPTDEGFIPKVTDFGLAKVLVEDGSGMQTRSGMTMGTPAYMAPEQVRDAANVDVRADIFALGAILYEMVCGRPPFDADDALTIFAKLASGDYPLPEELVPTLPERFRRGIRGCLMHDREARFADCRELREVFTGDEDSEASNLRVVPLSDAPHRTVAQTLEPAGHKVPSGSATYVADGVAGEAGATPPTMHPAMFSLAGEVPSLAPRGAAARASGAEPRSQGAPVLAVAGGCAGVSVAGAVSLAALFLVIPMVVPGMKGGGAPTLDDAAVAVEPLEDVASADAAEPVPVEPAEAAPKVAEPPEAVAVEVKSAGSGGGTTKSAAGGGTGAGSSGTSTARPASGKGILIVEGDASGVAFLADGKRHAAGEVPPGDYAIEASFDGALVPAGSVRVRAGQTLHVRCVREFQMCRAE